MRHARLSLFAIALASPTMPGAIQTAAFAQQAPTNLLPSGPPPAAVPTLNVPAPAPAPTWQRAAAEALYRYVEAIGQEGIDPAGYDPDRLRAAIDSGDDMELNAVATPLFARLVGDLSGGYVRGSARVDWHMPANVVDAARQRALLVRATGGDVAGALDSLLPTHPQYLGLKAALANTAPDDNVRRDLIRANMERWRWMPRDLGPRHVIVNVPAFTAALVEDGRVVARHRAVVGARRTPTPQLTATITAITVNPWWNVPQSISSHMRSTAGYQVREVNGTRFLRQPPGPRNALGRLKIEMPNQWAIYLHDTPAQSLFDRPVRAFSHGCIRTQYVRDFAADLLERTGGWDRAAIDAAIGRGQTRTISLAAPVPVYIAYFTAAATTDGNIVTYPDIYGRDAPVRQALNAAGTRTQQASRD
jgi:murein L,D-transpeptidase YcbB/YkuD